MFVARKIKAGTELPRTMWARLITNPEPGGPYSDDTLEARAKIEALRCEQRGYNRHWFMTNSSVNKGNVQEKDAWVVTWSDFEAAENEFGIEIP